MATFLRFIHAAVDDLRFPEKVTLPRVLLCQGHKGKAVAQDRYTPPTNLQVASDYRRQHILQGNFD
jgi:hypothetical protein